MKNLRNIPKIIFYVMAFNLFFLSIIYLHKDNILYTNIAAFYGKISFPIINYFQNKKNISCINNIGKNVKNQNIDYSFFVAGHVYGDPYSKKTGIHPQFYNHLKSSKKKYDFAIFAGDITGAGNVKQWKLFKSQLDELNIKKYFIAPGNHDIGNFPEQTDLFEEYFNNVNFKFVYKNDLFIILNAYENNWSIKNDELKFLMNSLKEYQHTTRNVFIITHPPIFYKKDLGLKVNSFDRKGKKLNFWNEVFPLLKGFEFNYFLIAGDLGAHKGKEIFCLNRDNFYFLGTGMGAGDYDNFLEFSKSNKEIIAKATVF